MIPMVTVGQMRAIDEEAIGGNVSVGYSYMLKAGTALFGVVREMIPDRNAGDIAIICGKGNNGGDGYVVGRLLVDAGYGVMCFGLCDREGLRGEARKAFDEYTASKGSFAVLEDVEDPAGEATFALIIDAVLGTGIKGDPRGPAADVLRSINSRHSKILAVDTPSGLNNDTGAAGNPCVRAEVTVTMGFPKLGTCFYPGKSHVGRLVIKDLGYPDEIVEKHHDRIYFPTPESLRPLLPGRRQDGSKIEHGLAFMLCGSRGMTGSAALAATSALRTGCGMVFLAAPRSAIPVLASKLTETVLHEVDETAAGAAALSAADTILEVARSRDALCIGPGLSHGEETMKLVRKLLPLFDKPILLDGDGINAFKGRAEELKDRNAPLILTPHRGEWKRVFGELPDEPASLLDHLRNKAHECGAVIVLKGNPTLVANPAGTSWVLPFGNSALATAGTGDVLSGMITSLLAQGCSASDAAVLGVYLHQCAGVTAGDRHTQYATIAGDVISHISSAIGSLMNVGRSTERKGSAAWTHKSI